MGGLMVLGAAVGFGLSPMLAQLLLQQGFTPEVIALFRFAIPLLIMLPFLRRLNLSDAESLRTIAIGALMGCGMLIHLYSYDWLPAALVIQIYYTYPLFAMGLGWALFRQPATQNRLIAAGLIVIAVSIMLDPSDLGEQPLWVLPLSFMAPVSYALLLNYFAKPVRATNGRLRCRTSASAYSYYPLAGPDADSERYTYADTANIFRTDNADHCTGTTRRGAAPVSVCPR
mgnify:CR=1 FL=1